MSTFRGLEMAKQALYTQQSALHTTGHNIANANTEGYTRQRVNFETTSPYPSAARNRPQIPGQMGTGVQAGSIQRIRNEYLDTQFRGENSLAGYWETRSNALSRMENLLNEPSETGLSASMDQFWQALQDLSVNPENSGARSVVVQRGQALGDTFNYLTNSMETIRGDLKQQIDTTEKNANTILKQIDEINKEVKKLEVHGYVTNDLYDRRDSLIDELSGIMDIDVKRTKSSDSAPATATGVVTISVKGIDEPLVDGENGGHLQLDVDDAKDSNGFNVISSIRAINSDGTAADGELIIPPTSEGSLNAFVKAYGYLEPGTTSGSGDYVDMLTTFKDMMNTFSEKFNEVHAGQDEDPTRDDNEFFFIDPENGTMYVNPEIMDNPDLVAASNDGNPGNGGNAQDLADVFSAELTFSNEETATIKDFYRSVIGDLGVKGQEAIRMFDNTTTLKTQVENQRMSVSSVSLDEEMTNLIQFQHAYNAAARSMTAVDELLDRVINNMGLVGR